MGLNRLVLVIAGIAICGLGTVAFAKPADWAAWTTSTGAPSGTVTGTIPTEFGSVNVTYTGEIFFSQINNAGTYFYTPSAPFINPSVPNQPPRADIITLQGGTPTGVHKLEFSPPVNDPIMAIVSLGQPGIQVTYDFDVPFTILSYGPGYWGGPGTLNNVGGQRLTGVEGHGTIRFIGSVSAITWTIPNPETWHGFTVGLAGPPCPCDLNSDKVVDDADFVVFIQSFNILDCLDPEMPARCPSDFNGDSAVDDKDFLLFVQQYNALICPE